MRYVKTGATIIGVIIGLGTIAGGVYFLEGHYATAEEVKTVLRPVFRSLNEVKTGLSEVNKALKDDRLRNKINWYRNEIKLYRLRSGQDDCGIYKRVCLNHQQDIDDLKAQLR